MQAREAGAHASAYRIRVCRSRHGVRNSFLLLAEVIMRLVCVMVAQLLQHAWVAPVPLPSVERGEAQGSEVHK